ncbi:polyadenylate-binding protein 6 isoform X1 [Ziziphus jujuba]|uniref:Polyadenylate-binding protein 6 isoform X1 n=1 Tax=Ziziphus jujuba TaxID=326968 RepID=A0A6P6FQJ2_ZIZJJ|nr:polyadenylate-binding protein 6 isoform X1 [Ziziphus jujuba]
MAAEVGVLPTPKPPSPADDPVRKSSLYVGDLDPQVTEADLMDTFRCMGPIASVRLCRDSLTGDSLRYAYVNFFSFSHASKALNFLNHTELKGKPMRIMWSQRDPLTRKTGIGNLFVKNLDPSITSGQLQHMFSNYGTILSCKVAEENGKSKGFGFVQFNSEESALAARDALHDTLVKGKKIYVSKFVKKSMRTVVHEESSFTNLYVKNLPEDVTEDLLLDMFSRFGKVSSIAIMRNDQGKSRGFGFVNFHTPEEAMKAVEVLNGSLQGPNGLSVARAQKKAERIEVLKNQRKEIFNCHIEKLKAQNLYVKNLDISVDESKLQKHFSVCGKIISVKVMRHANGISRRFGFVCFSTPEEATKALHTFNGSVLGGRSLYVAFAQSKEDRNRELRHYSQLSQRDLRHTALHPTRPVHYNFTPYSSFYSPPYLPLTYQHYGTNIGMQFPFFQNYHHHLSTNDLMRQKQQGNNGNQSFQQNKNGFTPIAKSNDSRLRISRAKNENKQGGLQERSGSVVPTERRNSDDLDASSVCGQDNKKNSAKSI